MLHTKALPEEEKAFIKSDDSRLRMSQGDRNTMCVMAGTPIKRNGSLSAAHAEATRFFIGELYKIFGRQPRDGYSSRINYPEKKLVHIKGGVLDPEQIREMFSDHDKARFLTSNDGEEVGIAFFKGGRPLGGIYYLAQTSGENLLEGYDGVIEEMWIKRGKVEVTTEDGVLSGSIKTVNAVPSNDRYLYVSIPPGDKIILNVKEAAYVVLRWTDYKSARILGTE